jgi:hypothetical protein
MEFRRLLVVLLAAVAMLPSACLKPKKESSLLAELNKPKLPPPQPPLPTTGEGAAPSGGVQPPKFDPKSSPVPALPGMPGTASQPLPPASVPDSPTGKADALDGDALFASATPAERQAILAASDEDRPGVLERIRARLQERRKEKEQEKQKEKPPLPPAVEPRPPMPVPVPPKDDALPKADAKPVQPIQAKEPAKNDLKAVREVLDAAKKKNDATASFEAHLVKREVVKGKEQPAEEAAYRFRKEPLSVHIRVTGEVGAGREVMWVKGQNDNKMTVVVGKGDNILFAAGKKMTMDPDDPLVTAKSRYRIYEAGMQRPIGALTKFVEQAEAGKRAADTIRYVGPVDRKEYKTKPIAVEVTLTADDDKFLPKGGKRVYHFDADPKSPAFGLPVLVISLDHENKEVEYYCFTDFKLVGELTDADFDHTKLGKKK